MKNTLKWRSILLLGLVLLLFIPLVSCNRADDEIYNYLSEMQEWQDKWNEKWSWELEELDDLVDELRAIESPRHPIPLEFSGVGTIDYWTFSDHNEYIFAHRDWLTASWHMETMQELEERRFIAKGSDEIPYISFEESGYNKHPDVNPEYEQAYFLEYRATERLGFVRGKLLGYFVMYLPERSEGE